MKAARYLAGHRGSKGVVPMSCAAVAALPPLVNEGVTGNRLQEIEQAKGGIFRKSQMDAFIDALGLPPDWFDGVYPADRERDVTAGLGAVLRAIAADARARRQGPGASPPEEDEENPGGATAAGGDG